MNIAFDATPLLGQGTGVATFTRGAFSAIARRAGCDLVAYALSGKGHRALAGALPFDSRVVGRPMPAAVLLRLWQRADHPVVERWTGAVDVVHGTNFVVPPTARAAAVVTVHDLTSVHHPELCLPASLRYPRLIERAVARGAIVHTHAGAIAREIVESLAVPADRVRVVPSGIDDPVGGDPARGRALAGGDEFVLAVGTVEPRKGLPDLVAAFAHVAATHPRVRLVIAGAPGWGEDALREAVQRSALSGRITRLGYIDTPARADLLAAATVFAYPSLYEGFGYPPLEAMAAGVPVVASSSGSLPEVLGDAALLAPPSDPDALAAAIARVLDEPATRDALRSAGLSRAATFTWDECAAGLVGLYADALATR